MTNEEMQRAMEFIVEQQAQFAANIQRLEEQRIRDTPRLARVEESFLLLVQLSQNADSRLDSLDSQLTKHDAQLEWLEEHFANHDAQFEWHKEHIAKHDAQLEWHKEHIAKLEEQRIQDTQRVARLEDTYQILVQLAQNAEARLRRLERS